MRSTYRLVQKEAGCTEPEEECREKCDFGVLIEVLKYDSQDRNYSLSSLGQVGHRMTLISSFSKDGVSNSVL